MTTLRLEQTSSATARVTLTRSESRNAINPQMAEEFAQAAADIARRGVHIAVLDAEGPAFCAGADLKELPAAGDALYSMLETLVYVPIHWTAVVRRAVRGAGVSLLAACPLVLASPEASFGLPELSRGFFPVSVVGGLTRAIGTRRAFDLAFRAEPVGVSEAEAMGLVSAVIPDGILETQLDVEVNRLVAFDTEALRVGIEQWQLGARVLLDREDHAGRRDRRASSA